MITRRSRETNDIASSFRWVPPESGQASLVRLRSGYAATPSQEAWIMNRGHLSALVLMAVLGSAVPALAQAPRLDYVWARSTNGAKITLDGNLNEPAWAMAESVHVQYGVDAGIPGSGWRPESGILPIDPTYATIKFLTEGDSLYVSFFIK